MVINVDKVIDDWFHWEPSDGNPQHCRAGGEHRCNCGRLTINRNACSACSAGFASLSLLYNGELSFSDASFSNLGYGG